MEFKVTYMEAIQHDNGAVGLWLSIRNAVELAIEKGDELIVLCEDDHVFTEAYNRDYLFSNIISAYTQGAELLNGGVGGFGTAVPVSEHRSCVDWFWCTQFVVVFASLFQRILEYDFKASDTADGVLSVLARNKQVMFPPISTQFNFGYSDITPHPQDFQDCIFNNANRRLADTHRVYQQILKTIKRTE